MKPNVLLVVLDTVRAKSCSLYNRERETTAGLENIRSESLLFEQAVAPATWTVPSHAAMFTGKYPSEVGVHSRNKILPQEEETIATHLSRQGHSTGILSSNPFLTEGSQLYRGFDFRHTSGMRRTIFEDAFDPSEYVKRREYEHGIQRIWELLGEVQAPPQKLVKNILNAVYYKYRTCWKLSDDGSKFDPEKDDGASETITHFCEWVDKVQEPFYACLNFMEAHKPYRHRREYLPEWATAEDLKELSFDRDAYFTGNEPLNERKTKLLIALYEAEIRYLDQQLETLWDYLQEKQLWDDTLLIITSDHGEYLAEEDLLFHHHNRLSDPLIQVPLMVKYPGGEHSSQSVSTPVDLTQIYDTILDAVGQPPPNSKPLHPETTPNLIKSEYVCKEPAHSTDGYLKKYQELTTPARAIYDNETKYLLFKDGDAYKQHEFTDDKKLEDLEQVGTEDVPDSIWEFADFDEQPKRGNELDVSNPVQQRLEDLGYQ